MTGQGQGRRVHGQSIVTVEVRAVNNRFLKIQLRTADALSGLEPQVEAIVRQSLKRGSLQMGIHINRQAALTDYQLHSVAIESYYQQCSQLARRLGIDANVTIGQLLALPGVVRDNENTQWEVDDELAAVTLDTVTDALDCLNRMRRTEGEAMAVELKRQLAAIVSLIDAIRERAPLVIDDYRERLRGKLQSGISNLGLEVKPSDLIREVQLFVDRADIQEELVRLRSHLTQFDKLLQDPESQGRKLDFLIQEMFRETNTIGSKAGDSEIAQRVIDLKTIIEQMRELIQNAE